MSIAGAPLQLTSKNHGEWLVVTVEGALDHASSPALRQLLLDADDSSSRRVVLDLTRVEFVDSAGFGVITGARERASSRFGAFRVVLGTGSLSRVFDLAGIQASMDVYPTVDDAMS